MSIRQVAAELYKLTKKVEELEKRLSEGKPLSTQERQAIEKDLKEAKEERDRLRRMLDKAKGTS
jgi:predicted  nucleic acid-binding Zn-ribbon protein